MRSMFIFVWYAAILIFTCTASFHDLIHFGVLRFRWDGHPTFSEFLSPFPTDFSRNLLLQKIGHIIAFQILTFLLLLKFRSQLIILFLAASFASLTEFLQLYFSRGGRVFDIGFDLIGILVALGMASFFKITQSRQIELKK